MLRAMIDLCLREHGYCSAAVGSGGEALAWLEKHPARLMLLDYMLLDMLGSDLVERLRARGRRCALCRGHCPRQRNPGRGHDETGEPGTTCSKARHSCNSCPRSSSRRCRKSSTKNVSKRPTRKLQRQQMELQRAHDELEDRVRQRTAELAEANVRLRVEMDERRQAEERARQRQAELAHVASLNAVGEMVAEVAHELNQTA